MNGKNMVVNYKYGFEYKGIPYAWKDKKLFRLPVFINGKTQGFKKMKEVSIGKKKGYRVMNDRKTIDQLMEITEVVNFKYVINGKNSLDCPF